jgi:regulator of sigma D
MSPHRTPAPTTGAQKDRRGGTQAVVAKLIAERKEMLALYCRVAGLEPLGEVRTKNPGKPAAEVLQAFCQLLIDYIAAGHFSLYERIASGNERRREVATLAAQLYPRIAETTQTALDFNDKYDCGDHCEIGESLHKDLSRLGEELALRIELEDKLISKMLG